ncbi:homeodomain-interacting protein kinase 1-like isoform X2 [Lates japonicus]|uniref:Homeodomain-interacting protein kinase 1-like isoform X2 n=1 Tax=Lates japonicus TaxID=270547 RepID=A0AAD3R9V2_LATJO|nr:homeodomain-interacting protein kinase 1-like isoform X2 [Lates japonicus]
MSVNFPAHEGTLLASRYEVQAFLGKGSFGKVVKCADTVTNTKALEVMHADLKPDNIMVVDRRQRPLRVKLIDFGLACHMSAAVPGSCVQSLWYRETPDEFASLTGYRFRNTRCLRSLDALEKMMYFKNKAERKQVQHFVDLVSVEQQTDSSPNMNITDLTHENPMVNMEEPNVTQQGRVKRIRKAFSWFHCGNKKP